jgi:uncharacterized membrane protein YgcG
MRRTLVFFILFLGVSLVSSASLRITDFLARISLDDAGTLNIEETIDVDFYSPHHGIERWIPVSYRRPTGENISIDVKVNAVTSNGGQVTYTTRRSGRNIIIRVGNPDRTITGAHSYTICYAVNRALLFREDYIQLYWNVTGNGWQIPIDHASAMVALPATVTPTDVSTTSYAGYTGSVTRGGAATLDDKQRFVFTAGLLTPGEGLTIDMAIPRTQLGIAPPSMWQHILWFLAANKYAALPLLSLIGMFFLWYYRGKDPAKATIAPRFEPPQGMHPGAVGVLIDDRADLRDISAMVIGLAVKGYLVIKEVSDEEEGFTDKIKGFLGRSGPIDYMFIKGKEADADLSNVEKTLFAAIFDDSHSEKRALSSLENEFYKSLPQIKADLYAGLIKAGYYPHNPERTRRSFVSFGTMIGIAGIAIGIGSKSLYLGAAIALCGLIVLAFSPIMPRKTKKGVLMLQDILGLSEYIGRAEVERMEFHNAPEKNPKLFEKLLPYAISLNLTSIWTKQFEGLLQQPPEWYIGTHPGLSPALFYLGIMNLSSGMERTFVSAPRTSSSGRSAWGGGGSFGGGFSGGGFGGGGGGGW